MSYQETPRRGTRPARFPNRIREYRVRAALSQRELGRLVGRSENTIMRWERGHRLPAVPDLFKLARALDTLGESLYIGLYRLYRREEGSNDTAA
jgi:transcriptional regulator with XRE-family HTH domain